MNWLFSQNKLRTFCLFSSLLSTQPSSSIDTFFGKSDLNTPQALPSQCPMYNSTKALMPIVKVSLLTFFLTYFESHDVSSGVFTIASPVHSKIFDRVIIKIKPNLSREWLLLQRGSNQEMISPDSWKVSLHIGITVV